MSVLTMFNSAFVGVYLIYSLNPCVCYSFMGVSTVLLLSFNVQSLNLDQKEIWESVDWVLLVFSLRKCSKPSA